MTLRVCARNLLPLYRNIPHVPLPWAFGSPYTSRISSRYVHLPSSEKLLTLHELVLKYAHSPDGPAIIKAALNKKDERTVLNKEGKRPIEVASQLGDYQMLKTLRDWNEHDVTPSPCHFIPFSTESMFVTASSTSSFAPTVFSNSFDSLAVYTKPYDALAVFTPQPKALVKLASPLSHAILLEPFFPTPNSSLRRLPKLDFGS